MKNWRDAHKGKILIYYEWWTGNCNMGFWTMELNGEVVDYHTRDELVKRAQEMDKGYVVLRHHKVSRRGEVSVTASVPAGVRVSYD